MDLRVCRGRKVFKVFRVLSDLRVSRVPPGQLEQQGPLDRKVPSA